MFLDHITAEILAMLGEAYLVPDNDCLYIVSTGSEWLLCIPAYASQFPAELVGIIETYTNERDGLYLTWDVLCAEVSLEHRQYLPAKSKSVKTLHGQRHPQGVRASSVREHLTAIGSVFGDRHSDLNDLFHQGFARAEYPKRAGPGASHFAQERPPEQYVFQYQGRVLALDGGMFSGFYKMGCRMWAPSARRDPKKIGHPLILVELDSPGSAVFGMMVPGGRSGIVTARDGRALYHDAAAISWATLDDATALIETDLTTYDPTKIPADRLEETFLERLAAHDVKTRLYSQPDINAETLLAVSILRWHGIEEVHIEALVEARRMPCYEAGYGTAVEEAQRMLSRVEATNLSSWEVSHARDRARNLRKAILTLAQVGITAEPGPLLALEQALNTRYREAG